MRKAIDRLKISMKSIRSKTIVFVIASCASVALLLITSFFAWYRRAAEEDYRQLVNLRLSDTDVVMNSYLDSTLALASSWFNSSSGTLTRVSSDFDVIENIRFVNQINDIIKYNTHIQSVYFINHKGEVPLWVKGEGRFTKNPHDKLIERLSLPPAAQGPYVWSIESLYTGEQVTLLTLFVSEASCDSGMFTGAVAVNIDLDVLCKLILNNDSGDAVIVLDENGIVSLHSDPVHIGEDWSGREYMSEISAGEGVPFQETIDGTVYEFMCVKSKRPGFYMLSQSEHIGVFRTSGLLTFLLAVLLVVSVVMVAAVLLVGARLFRPFTAVIGDLKKTAPVGIADHENDDVKFLHAYFYQMREHLSEMQRKAQLDRITRSLLTDSHAEDVSTMLLEYGALREGGAYYGLTVLFTDAPSVVDMQAVDRKRERIKSIYTARLSEAGKCTALDWGLRNLFFLISENAESPIEDSGLMELAMAAENEAAREVGAKLYGVLSRRAEDGAQSCRHIYRGGVSRMHLKWIYADGGTVFLSGNPRQVKPSADTVSSLLNALKQGNRSEYDRLVRKMAAETVTGDYDGFVMWVLSVSRQIMQVKAAMNKNSESLSTQEQERKIRMIESLHELYHWFELLYDDVAEKMTQAKKVTSADLLEEAVTFIRTNYDDDRLGAVMLAERLHISSHYFGQLFRQFTDCSITDYIIKVRMENARDLLISEPGMDISAIAKKVGYNSNSYFATAFKKYYGMSPSKLRSSLYSAEE